MSNGPEVNSFQFNASADQENRSPNVPPGNVDSRILQQQITMLAKQLEELQQRQPQPKGQTYTLNPEIQELIPAHLQVGRQVKAAERKAILKAYRDPDIFPKPIEDENGLAAKALPQDQRKWAIKVLPKLQRQELDTLKVAAAGLQWAFSNTPDAQKVQLMGDCLRDIIVLSADNAQKMAKSQLQEAFEAAKAPGAYALCKLESMDSELQLDDHSIFQGCHVQAIKTYRSYSSIVQKEKVNEYQKRKGSSSRGSSGYSRGSYRGRGNYRGNSRGGRGGRGGHQNRPNQGNDKAVREDGE